MTPYELLLGVLAAGTNVDGRMGTNGVPLRAVTPPRTKQPFCTLSKTVHHWSSFITYLYLYAEKKKVHVMFISSLSTRRTSRDVR